jgi:hypothetical protein
VLPILAVVGCAPTSMTACMSLTSSTLQRYTIHITNHESGVALEQVGNSRESGGQTGAHIVAEPVRVQLPLEVSLGFQLSLHS